ncbi:unnamed protein product [Mesocestoides corti]|uniref:Uncharacterized protein n=1 Tax=Mesocestoides corti TaxID=53468 RepID=A0A0R3UA70_MESCO|nr:unnamed protein product [Mesocestoides corti]
MLVLEYLSSKLAHGQVKQQQCTNDHLEPGGNRFSDGMVNHYACGIEQICNVVTKNPKASAMARGCSLTDKSWAFGKMRYCRLD